MICWNEKILIPEEPILAVFIGGTADGQRRWISERMPHISFPVCESARVVPRMEDRRAVDWRAVNLSFKEEHYRSFDMRAGGELFTVYALEGLSDVEVVCKLIEGYRMALAEPEEQLK